MTNCRKQNIDAKDDKHEWKKSQDFPPSLFCRWHEGRKNVSKSSSASSCYCLDISFTFAHETITHPYHLFEIAHDCGMLNKTQKCMKIYLSASCFLNKLIKMTFNMKLICVCQARRFFFEEGFGIQFMMFTLKWIDWDENNDGDDVDAIGGGFENWNVS